MKTTEATTLFTALSQETRLQVFKILIEYGHSGVAAGKISERLGIPHNTLSFHLTHLTQVGLISVEKNGRSMIYRANVGLVESLICYLQDNCCALEDGDAADCFPNQRKDTDIDT